MNERLFVLDGVFLTKKAIEYISAIPTESTLIIPKGVIDEINREASRNTAQGIALLSELEKIINIANNRNIKVTISEEKDSITIAREMNAILLTNDVIKSSISRLYGVNVILLQSDYNEKIPIENLFSENTMSIHLKEGAKPRAKVGLPGNWHFIELSDSVLTREEVTRIALEIIEAAKSRKDSFIEMDREDSTIIQLSNYRVIITRPPLSDGWEITAVRPVKKLKIEDYNLPPPLFDRLTKKAEGIIIAGAPGMGKTTFAQALAQYYSEMGKVVKTVESPRDMVLTNEITQLSKTKATSSELHDILLLSRPDYTIHDEMRDDQDFELYIDLRLAGIGMVGVLHANNPIDAIHRFLNRTDLGTIPNILDTVIFIDAGKVSKVYTLEMTVKLPSGMREADLARPVVEVKDFFEGKTEYEIYVFGEQTMIVPVKRAKENRQTLLANKLMAIVEGIIPDIAIETEDSDLVIKLPKKDINKLNKKISTKIKKFEKKYGIRIRYKVEE